MRRRWLAALGLGLAIGCSGAKGGPPRDGAPDDAADPGTRADATRDVIVIGGDGGHDARDASAEAAPADGPGADARPNADGAATGDGADAAVQSMCPAQIPTIALPSGPVTGTLATKSNNPIVSCQGGVLTDGPDAFFALTLTQTTTVDFHVSAPFETFVAVRPGPCSDSISEVACGQDQSLDVLPTATTGGAGFSGIPLPPFPISTGGAGSFGGSDVGADAAVVSDAGADAAGASDAGVDADADAASPFQTDLRVRLSAGTYTIVVDTFAPGASGENTFTLSATAIQPLANGSCATPTLLTSGATAPDQALDLAGAPSALCGGTRAALFYSVGVPPGQRLTARATPKLGDRAWMPHLAAFTACSSSACLAQGHSAAGETQELDWTNNGSDWQLVDLAVTADGPVTGATFDLNVAVLDLMATCSRPTPLKDGTSLLAQDLSIAPSATFNACNGNTDHAFFYSATLLPLQSIEVFINPTASQSNNPFFVNMGLVSSCDTTAQCEQSGPDISFTNGATTSTTVLFELSSQESGLTSVFDLHVSMPPPPAHIIVTPTSGLVTSESGTTATFQVSLTSPPTSTVSIAVASDTPTEGKATPATVTFTPATWMTPVTVTVVGVDDSVSDGPQAYKIITSPAVSTDARYQGLNPDDVSCTNLDNDPGIELIGADDVVTSESGRQATFGVQLNSAPGASVTLPLSSSNTAEGTVSPDHLVFDATNWNKSQTVTVTGVDDTVADGTQAYTIVTGALVSTDPAYGGQNPPDVAAHNLDDDYGAVTVKLLSGDHACNSTNGSPIAVDELNRIYLVMDCETGLWLTTSNDGGVTFGDPTLIPNTSDAFTNFVELAAGPGGFVYLAYLGSNGVSFLRSIDAGATWSTPMSLVPQTSQLQIVAAKHTLTILTDSSGGQGSTFLWRSADGGASFLGPTWLPDTNLGVGVSPDGSTDWLLELSGNTSLEKSTDGGATFTTVGSVGTPLSQFAFGAQSLFGFGNGNLLIESLADPTSLQQGSVFYPNTMAVTVDDAQTATSLDTDPNTGRLRANRVRADASPPDVSQTVIGPGVSTAGVVPLSRKAVAVGLDTGGVILYTTVTFP
ncbi:MAG TPA: sialidase family protein [Polyangia bacterium]|jgi:hypothetical protein|nr:sialidase family protein [Polyangia bacterium]